MLDGLLLAVAPVGAPLRGANLGVIFFTWLRGRADKKRTQLEAEISRTPTSILRATPNQVYTAAELRSINLKSGIVPITIPDVVLEMADGSRKKFGIYHLDFAKARTHLQQMYPHLCQPR